MDYCCGFMVTPNPRSVMLILKNRPAFQAGKWNGIGGKLEAGETPLDAMVREFREETGIETNKQDWDHTITMSGLSESTGKPFSVSYFRMFVDTMPTPKQMTDELVCYFNANYVNNLPVLDNFRWIFPLQFAVNIKFPLDIKWEPSN